MDIRVSTFWLLHVNIQVFVWMYIFILLGRYLGELLGQMATLSFLWTCQTVFHSSGPILESHSQCGRRSNFLTTSSVLHTSLCDQEALGFRSPLDWRSLRAPSFRVHPLRGRPSAGGRVSTGSGVCAAACAPRKRKRAPVPGRLIRGLVLSQAAPRERCGGGVCDAVGGSLLGDPAGTAQFRQRSPLLPSRLATAGGGEQWTRRALWPFWPPRREPVHPNNPNLFLDFCVAALSCPGISVFSSIY